MSLHKQRKSTCSCHPDSMIDKMVAAIDAETTRIALAFLLGFVMGGCAYYALTHVRFERHRLAAPLQVPSCAESLNCTSTLATLGGTAVE